MELLGWYKRLSALRKSYKCFADGKYTLIEARSGLFAFKRGEDRECVLVVINTTGSDRVVKADGFNYDILNDRHTDALVIKSGEPGMFAKR